MPLLSIEIKAPEKSDTGCVLKSVGKSDMFEGYNSA